MIRFTELVEDRETFEFRLEDAFFQMFESSEWEGGSVIAGLEVSKRADGITLDIRMEGYLTVACDRCLELFPLDVKSTQQVFVKYGAEEMELDDNVIVVSKEENHLDLSPLFYDFLVLSIPVSKVHPTDSQGNTGCDIQMIEALEKHIITEENEKEDPRWDELKKLLDKN
jgi:uncharacterized metal-binding protein YceD (DUF177 family)